MLLPWAASLETCVCSQPNAGGGAPKACALWWDTSVTLFPFSVKLTWEGAGRKYLCRKLEKLAACFQDPHI